MRPIGVLVALLLMLAGGSHALATAGPLDGVSDGDVSSIRQVIQGQLDAFQADDGVRAFSFASPAIQAIFRDPASFMRMVRTGYRPVYRPRQVEFGQMIEFQGKPTQIVTLIGPGGRVVATYYQMERQERGVWRIDGCVLREAPAV